MTKLAGKVIILNSPPDTGKDTVADAICNTHTHTKHRQFKDKLYEITAMLFNRNLLSFKHAANDRILKETPSKYLTVPSKEFHKITAITKSNRAFTIAEGCTLSGDYNVPISPREALVYVSEIVIKPRFGDKYFGLAAADSIKGDANGSVFSDGGFQEELSPIADVVGEENVYIVQFTRGDKLNFLGDSRNWLQPYGNINLIQTTNDGTIDEVVNYILSKIKQ